MSKIDEQKALEKTTKNIEAFGLTKTFNWMKEISEQKALEAYPKETYYDRDVCDYVDVNATRRDGYIKGYDQAFQDFLDKAEEFLYLQLNNGSIECGNIERLIDDLKNHMQDESEN